MILGGANGFACPLAVVDEDDDLLAVDKPAGMIVDGYPGTPYSLSEQVRSYLGGPQAYVGIPHRLDRPVSGVVLYAKNKRAAASLAQQFHARLVQKTYWAFVERPPDPPDGTLRDWLLEDLGPPPLARRLPEWLPDAREGLLRYRTLEVGAGGSLLAVALATGRFHQIRAQLAGRGCPIVGDDLYGGRPAPWPFALALHARRLELFHPRDRRLRTWHTPPPQWWAELGVALPAELGDGPWFPRAW